MLVLVLKVVLVVSAVVLTVLVVLQDNRGGGLAGVLAGYGGESAFGTETVSKVKKLTAYLGALFFASLLALAIVGQRSDLVIGEGLEQAPTEQPAGPSEPAPPGATPAAPAPPGAAPAAPAEPAPGTTQ